MFDLENLHERKYLTDRVEKKYLVSAKIQFHKDIVLLMFWGLYACEQRGLPLTQQVASGFNQQYPPHRTVAMAVDFSKAIDTVNHTALLRSLGEKHLELNTMRWLCTYLRGRTASCRYNRVESAGDTLHCDVPQSSILSPLLLNFYVSTYPETSPLCTSYADDFTATASDPRVEVAANALAEHARDLTA